MYLETGAPPFLHHAENSEDEKGAMNDAHGQNEYMLSMNIKIGTFTEMISH